MTTLLTLGFPSLNGSQSHATVVPIHPGSGGIVVVRSIEDSISVTDIQVLLITIHRMYFCNHVLYIRVLKGLLVMWSNDLVRTPFSVVLTWEEGT